MARTAARSRLPVVRAAACALTRYRSGASVTRMPTSSPAYRTERIRAHPASPRARRARIDAQSVRRVRMEEAGRRNDPHRAMVRQFEETRHDLTATIVAHEMIATLTDQQIRSFARQYIIGTVDHIRRVEARAVEARATVTTDTGL